MNENTKVWLTVLIIVVLMGAIGVFSDSEFVDVHITGNTNITGRLNMSNSNITSVDCVHFNNGGRIGVDCA